MLEKSGVKIEATISAATKTPVKAASSESSQLFSTSLLITGTSFTKGSTWGAKT